MDSKRTKYLDDKGYSVVRLDKALYGCGESTALYHENMSACLMDAGIVKNECDICVIQKKVAGTR